MTYPRLQSEKSRTLVLASLVGLLFLLVGYGSDLVFADSPFSILDDVIACAGAGALVYTYRRREARQRQQGLDLARKVDLYVRNELRAMTLGCRLPQERCLNCIERLDYVLGEMLQQPATAAPPAEPGDIAELRDRRIIAAQLYRDELNSSCSQLALNLQLDNS